MAVDTTEQVVREAPDIEAFKVGLLRDALDLAKQPVGVPQYDADGNMIMEDYQFTDAEGNVQTGQRPFVQLPQQQIAGMSPLQREALAQAAGGIGGFQPYLQGAAGTLGQAQTRLAGVSSQMAPFQTRASQYLDAAGQGVGTQVSGAQQGITSALRSGLGDTRAAQTAAGQAATGLGTRGREIVGQLGTDLAPTTETGRAFAGQAAGTLGRAGRFGMGTAARGIADLFGSTREFDPTSTQRFMNPFEQQVVDQTLADIARQGDIQRQQQRAQAVSSGAFGGSRSGIVESELDKNVLEQQAKAASQLRRAGFESAAQRSQQAFEEQQRRQQQAAQLTGTLGAQGSQAQARAADAAGRLGLSAEQFASANAQSLARTGLGLEQAAAQTGLSAADLAGRLGQNLAQMGMQGAQASGQLGLQGLGMQADIGKGIAALGSDAARIGLEQGRQLGTLGIQQAGLGELGQNLAQREQGFLFDLGKREQAQNQALLEAQRANQMAQIYEPYQRVGFLSDIYKGAPTSQMSVTSQSSPNVSPAQTFLGLGVAGLSAAAGANRAGLFG